MGIVERLREEALALQQTAWSRMDGGQQCSLNASLAEEAADEIERLRAALESIAANTCCDRCQEAALVARAALKGEA